MRSALIWGEMIKIEHSVFALPFALLATFLAARPGLPAAGQLVLIIICMVAASSAAMTFNRLVDVTFDARNPRTAGRALPRGQISRAAAWLFFGVSCAAFVAGAAGFSWWYANPWPIRLALPVLAFLCFYSLSKRFTRWSHVLLGAAIAFAPVAAWIAIQPQTLGAPAWLLMVAVTFWIGGFDLIYACQDVEFDRAAGLFSVPAQWGIAPALWLARSFHVLTLAALAGVGVTARLGAWYAVGVGLTFALLVYEHALVSPRDLRRVNMAFFTINGVIGLMLGGLGILDILLA